MNFFKSTLLRIMTITSFAAICFSESYGQQGFIESTGGLGTDPDQDLFVNENRGIGLNKFNWSTEIKEPLHIFGYNVDWEEFDTAVIRFDTRFIDNETFSDRRRKIDIRHSGSNTLGFYSNSNPGGVFKRFLYLSSTGIIGLYGNIQSQIGNGFLGFTASNEFRLSVGNSPNSDFLMEDNGTFSFGASQFSIPSFIKMHGNTYIQNGLFVGTNSNGSQNGSALMRLNSQQGGFDIGISQGKVGGVNTMELTTGDGSGNQSTSIVIRGGSNENDIEFYSGSSGNESLNMKIDGNGKVVIGGGILDSDINCISNYKLFVQDGIRTEKVKIESITDWCDYVFADDYQLKPISEVKEFVAQNKHLPDVPSELSVKESGVELLEMNKILLKKVEELYLYTFQLNEEISKLKMEMNK